MRDLYNRDTVSKPNLWRLRQTALGNHGGKSIFVYLESTGGVLGARFARRFLLDGTG